MISEKTIQEAVELLIKAANPVRIILFGSYARGDVTEESDLDFLVIENLYTALSAWARVYELSLYELQRRESIRTVMIMIPRYR